MCGSDCKVYCFLTLSWGWRCKVLFVLFSLDYFCCMNLHMVHLCRSVVVSAGLLRIFGRELAELPVVATAKEHQGKVSALIDWNKNMLCSCCPLQSFSIWRLMQFYIEFYNLVTLKCFKMDHQTVNTLSYMSVLFFCLRICLKHYCYTNSGPS